MTVTLYTKADCRLCQDLRHTLVKVQQRLDFQVEEVDVSGHPDLQARFGADLPVLVIGDARFQHWASEQAIERVLLEKGAVRR